MRGFLHGSGIIAREKGIRGFFQGFVPTTARQAANSAVRFSSYTALKQLAQSYVAPGEKLGAVSTFGLGGLAGVITVYTTMPIDTVKTRYVSPSLLFKEESMLREILVDADMSEQQNAVNRSTIAV